LEADVGHRKLRARQLPCRSFQKQSPPHGDRRFLDDCPEHAIKLRPAPISVAGEAVRIPLLIERVENDFAQPLCFIHNEQNTISQAASA